MIQGITDEVLAKKLLEMHRGSRAYLYQLNFKMLVNYLIVKRVMCNTVDSYEIGSSSYLGKTH